MFHLCVVIQNSNLYDTQIFHGCSWSRPIRTKSVFSRLVMFIETKPQTKPCTTIKENKLT